MSFNSSVYISSITLRIQQKYDNISLQTRTGGFKRDIRVQLTPGQEHKEVFDTPFELSARDELSISMQYQPRLRIGRSIDVTTMKQSEIMGESRVETHGKRIYTKLCKTAQVTIDFSYDSVVAAGAPHADQRSMPESIDFMSPTTNDILRICPRFRLLVIGNTGVGKSSLIKNVFGVKDALVSEASRGKADIDKEFIAEENGLFVLHDSLGLEAGEGANLEKVKNFIRERREKEDPRQKLHAVWVCLEVPYAKGQLLDAGMKQFLRDRKQILGDIPVVVVLTKLDLLDNSLMLALRAEGAKFRTIEEARPLLEPRRAMFLNEHCVQLLEREVGDDIPHVAVSTRSGYSLEQTISELMKTTTLEIERYIRADPQYGRASEQLKMEYTAPLYVAGMAQRASIERKVDLTIEIGEKGYWKKLDMAFTFTRERVEKKLAAIHRDIVQVWNFNDPENALQDDKFKGVLLDILSGRDVLPAMDAFSFPFLGGLASSCLELFMTPQTAAKRFMAYIADLVYVMKIIFILTPHKPVTAQDIAAALHVYTELEYRKRVHLEVNDFDANTMLPGRDKVLEKIKVLIRRYDITDQEVSRLQS